LSYIKKKYSYILSHPNSVSVHLRYYYREKPDDESFIQYENEYYEKAMKCFPKDSLFVVVSDNIAFAKNNISTQGRNVVFIEKEPFYIDFYLQTLCKNNIISNSTFSWWGAWLNQNSNKIVIRPKKWLGDYPDINCPADWITIEAQSLQDKILRLETQKIIPVDSWNPLLESYCLTNYCAYLPEQNLIDESKLNQEF
jgi:hypothetical protein